MARRAQETLIVPEDWSADISCCLECQALSLANPQLGNFEQFSKEASKVKHAKRVDVGRKRFRETNAKQHHLGKANVNTVVSCGYYIERRRNIFDDQLFERTYQGVGMADSGLKRISIFQRTK